MSKITVAEFQEIAAKQLPFAVNFGFAVTALEPGKAWARAPYHQDFLRPGGTIAGPVLMGLADFALYGAVLSLIGRVELAVTTSLNINFLRRPPPGDVVAEARILKLGKRLAVGEVNLMQDGSDELIAHVTSTYSIPPQAE
ncbi:MAG: PaaI family thioesterase [Gammaproteobacteria bacterium]|nr:PaaI family thioesterase [Gammaproteobacteria bacterium]MDH3467178.1 PaaI family thioesterase [Gammaproteobacteria bacterium]